uniref:uncharacterized protein LOC105352810 isoform X2 n=1 Tax=Fragaria vesca subsp. vesca TaxID=101020 RepID=UPI0005CAC186|nr:PREDICTED: uncharacterized protein LOC105352810 isoform X2 [Fragaria vesca subsp. vesca]
MEGQVRSVYLTLRFFSDDDTGALLHEIQIDNEGIPLMNSTTEKPVRPERQLVDKTEITTFPFIRCERIGSELYLFAGPHYQATAKVGYIFDAKSDGELVKFHDLPFISRTCPTIMAAHGRLYHLATPKNDRDGEPMPFEVYDHSTKSWDPLPPLPQCRVLPDPQSPSRMYSGYAVWGTCILVSLWYFEPKCFVPVLFDAKSRTWHHVDVAQQKLEEECFPWDDKAVVVGNTIYALGFEPGIISFSIEKSGSEEDGTLMYSLTSPYKLEGLELHRDPHYPYFDRMFQCWAPLGDFEFCFVQTMDHPSPTFIPLFITMFKIIQKEGTSSRIETLRSSLQFMSTEDYGQFWPIFCCNPDYEPNEVMLTTSKDTRNRIADISTSICYLIGMLSNYVSFRDIKPKEASLTNRKVL